MEVSGRNRILSAYCSCKKGVTFRFGEEEKATEDLRLKENIIMKDRLLKAFFASITVALGITIVTIVQNEDVSFVKTGLYATVAFIVDFVFSYIYDQKKR